MIRFAICIIIFAILSPLIIGDDPCKVTDTTKGTIDITSLSSTDGSARFKDLTPSQGGSNWSMYLLFLFLSLLYSDYFGIEYSFNPCKPFTEDTCVDVAVCQGESQLLYIIVFEAFYPV